VNKLALANTQKHRKPKNEMSKPKPAWYICKNCSYVCAHNCVHCTQYSTEQF